ncbi:MAG: PPC domain-containing protein [Deltaproteobacteria bacterium]|nr:PPC domain-containing protein [Deltaproteobacteria bacterium]
MTTKLYIGHAVVLTVVGAYVSGCIPEQKTITPTDISNVCQSSDQCAKGEICSNAGVCIIGDCTVREDCPHPLDQLCNELNRCIPDPASPIGNECPNGTRDCEMGEFCSAGTCYNVADAEICTRQSDCSAGQRCDPVNGFCVDDRGGCNRANEYPELACAEGDLCDAVTGHCSSPTGLPCTVETELADCGESMHCIGNRCVQCTSNDNCGQGDNICCDGAGTQCNIATGRCVSAFLCTEDEDCTGCRARPGLGVTLYCSDHSECEDDGDCSSLHSRRCAVGTGECVQPACTDDDDCDYDERCDLSTFQCYEAPAECEETNEPNNTVGEATPVSTSPFSDLLCRGDVDYLRLQGHANTRLHIEVGVSPGSSYVTVEILDSAATILRSASFSSSGTQLAFNINVAADAPFYVLLRAANYASADEYNYTVSFSDLPPLTCNNEAGEPNDSIAEADGSTLTVDESLTRVICGESDQDYFKFTAPANQRSIVTATFTGTEGNINLQLVNSGGTLIASSTNSSASVEKVTMTATSDTVVYARVYRTYTSSAVEAQSYTILLQLETPPPCADPEEPNDTFAQTSGSVLHVGPSITRVLCGTADVDYYRVEAEMDRRTTVTANFIDAEGDIELRLYNLPNESDYVDSSTGVTDIEEVSYSSRGAATTLYVKVYRGTYSIVEENQAYSLTVTSSELPVCVDSYEPNGDRSTAPSIGFGTHQATLCDVDDLDFYAIPMMSGGDLTITLTYASADPDIDIQLQKADGSSVRTDYGYSGEAEIAVTALAGGIYYLKVYPGDYYDDPVAEPYTIAVSGRLNCVDDDYEGFGNNTIATATPLRDEALNSFSLETSLKLCGTDDDWYRLVLLGDEMLETEVVGPTGIGVELYQSGASGDVLVAAGRETAVAAGRSTIYLGFHVPGRGAIYYLRVYGGGIEERSYNFKLTVATDTCAEDSAECNDAPVLATPVTPPRLTQSGVLCPLRDVDLYQVSMLPGRTVQAAFAFDASDGDIDVVATLDGQEVAAARNVNSSGSATETVNYTGTGCGDLYISVQRHANETAASIPYSATIDVAGGTEVDGGCGG